jgi:hypothetical protein
MTCQVIPFRYANRFGAKRGGFGVSFEPAECIDLGRNGNVGISSVRMDFEIEIASFRYVNAFSYALNSTIPDPIREAIRNRPARS